jgi:hypothetical protein
MTPEAILAEVLDRVGTARNAVAVVSEYELGKWQSDTVAAMKSHGLITKARPASSAVCSGCERECAMPVHVMPDAARSPEAFIVCDKRNDINRVAVPVSRLEQWQASGDSIADLLADLLGLHRSGPSGTDARWNIGVYKGTKHASHLELIADGRLALTFAGHTMALADVLTLEEGQLVMDRRTLNRLVDHPVAGAGDAESAEQRRARLRARVSAEKANGTKAFLKVVAAEEGFSVSRLKQLLREEREAPNPWHALLPSSKRAISRGRKATR